jgi:protein-S-isoprenylcysteine O-methyltransferase Ste14
VNEAPGETAGVIVLPPLLWGGPLLFGLLLQWLLPLDLEVSRLVRHAGGVLALASGALAKWGEVTLKRAGTNVRPDRPTTAIVTAGPYRLTRNPLYLSLLGLYVGVTVAVGTIWPLIWLPLLLVVTHYGIIRREERYLAARFGEPYLEYTRRVRRWI